MTGRKHQIEMPFERERPTDTSRESRIVNTIRNSDVQVGAQRWRLFFFLRFVQARLCWVFVAAGGHSLVAARRATLVAEHRFLSALISLVVQHSLECWPSTHSNGLSCPTACGILLDQGSNPPHWVWIGSESSHCIGSKSPALDSLPLSHQGSPRHF